MERGILCLTFDNMGAAREVGRGLRAGPNPNEPSLIIGYPNVLDLLDRLQLHATFFIEGWNALHHPEAVRELVRRGHEVGMHGWTHEVFHELGEIEAERVLTDSLAAFRRIGIMPRGFRAPGGVRGAYTPAILQRLGLSFDSSVDEIAVNTQPSMLEYDVPNIPWEWPMVDYYQYYMHPEGARAPRDIEKLWGAKVNEAARKRILVTVILHAFVSGVEEERLAVIRRLLKDAKDDSRIEILTAGEVADRMLGGAFN
jgi:peptidoglycan-N-acetylglucosamine deacetylase